MKAIFTRKEFALALACALAFAVMSESTIAQVDRRGAEAANQILSEERVDAVKAYLVDKGIVAERVQTSASGETRPTTRAGECKDANNTANVACMQADRHVFIEVSGTRLAQ